MYIKNRSKYFPVGAAASVACLLASGAALAKPPAEDISPATGVYTGCRGPGGNLIHVMEGYEPAQWCAPSFVQITWNEAGQDGQDGMDGQDGQDGMDGQDGVSGYVLTQTTGSISGWQVGEERAMVAKCPPGKRVLGGGVFLPSPTTATDLYRLVVTSSFPQLSQTNDWEARAVNLGTGAGSGFLPWRVFITCADVAED